MKDDVMVIRSGAEQYCFFWRDQVQGAGDPKAANRILTTLAKDPKAMASLRKIPKEVGHPAKLDDEALIATLEDMIVAGRLLIGSDLIRGRSTVTEEQASPRPASAPAKQETKREPEEERPTFQPRSDGAAQAAGLRAAAEQGTPFCEECERAARENQEAA